MYERQRYKVDGSLPEGGDTPYKYDDRIKLRDYQIVGRDWLRKMKRVFLTDKPGMGKTVQASEAAVPPVLVFAPTYLTQQWYDHITKQHPDQTVSYATGTQNRFNRQKALDKKADWYICNHQMLRGGFTFPEKVNTVIFDESHHLRNRNAMQSVGAAKIAAPSDRRVYNLTATPMWKDASDLWMQLHILQPDVFSSYHEFIDLFCIVDETPYGPKILGVKKSMRKELDKLLRIISLGRTYKDVGRVLPQTIKSTIKVNFPDELTKKYRQLKNQYALQLEEEGELWIFSSYIAVLHTLRKFTNFPGKQDAAKDRLEDVGKPALLFTWYKDTAEVLQAAIPNSVLLNGDMKPDERHARAMKAQNKGKHIVATMSSLSEGINLQQYRHVMFYEQDWPPGRNFQALSRVVRDRNDNGQDIEPVIVDYVLVPKTVDEVIHKVAQQREASIKDVMKDVLL